MIKVAELASELGIEGKELILYLDSIGSSSQRYNSEVSEEQVKKARNHFAFFVDKDDSELYFPIFSNEIKCLIPDEYYFPILAKELEATSKKKNIIIVKNNNMGQDLEKVQSIDVEEKKIESACEAEDQTEAMYALTKGCLFGKTKYFMEDSARDELKSFYSTAIADGDLNPNDPESTKIYLDLFIETVKTHPEVIHDGSLNGEGCKTLIRDIRNRMGNTARNKKTDGFNLDGYSSLFDALKEQRHPIGYMKKDENGEFILDKEKIEKGDKQIGLNDDEKIVYVEPSAKVALVDKNSIKKEKRGIIIPKDYIWSSTLIITNHRIISMDYLANRFNVDKSQVTDVEGIFVKSGLLSMKDSQIKIILSDERIILINECFFGKDKYEEFMGRIKKVLWGRNDESVF